MAGQRGFGRARDHTPVGGVAFAGNTGFAPAIGRMPAALVAAVVLVALVSGGLIAAPHVTARITSGAPAGAASRKPVQLDAGAVRFTQNIGQLAGDVAFYVDGGAGTSVGLAPG